MEKKCIIYEAFNSVETLNKQTGTDGLMRLSGVFGVCGIRNNNGRVYEQSNYSKMVSEMQGRIKTSGCPGELEHPNSMNINMENVSHKVETIDIDEQGVVSGTIVLLNTPKGKIAQAIVEGGLPLYISSRAQGVIGKNGAVQLQNLKTYDLVGTPGFSQAQLNLSTNQTFESINESCAIVYDEVTGDDKVIENQKIQNNIMEEKYISIIESLKAKYDELSAELSSYKSFTENLMETIDNVDQEEFVNKLIEEKYAPSIQNWFINEAAPTFADGIQKWVVEEFSPEVQGWFINEAAPTFADGIQKWVVEEFAGEVQNWIVEEYTPVVNEWFDKSIDESMKNIEVPVQETNTLDKVDQILDMLESREVNKPIIDMGVIKESKFDGQSFIATMPDHIVPKWEMASDLVKENLSSKAKLYDFSKEGVIDAFWAKASFAEPVIESVGGSKIISFGSREDAIRAQLRNFRK